MRGCQVTEQRKKDTDASKSRHNEKKSQKKTINGTRREQMTKRFDK